MKLTRRQRILAATAAFLLVGGLFLPLWSIGLKAPQYPEGLGLHIYAHTIRGHSPHDLQKINNLNHYIGMKPIHAQSIRELKIMPLVIILLVLLGATAATTGSKVLLLLWWVVLSLSAIGGLVDFYLWERDYGHNLNMEKAIIKVPGMSYQPPLLGTKRLLNFTAKSFPAAGGWLITAALILVSVAAIDSIKGQHPHEKRKDSN